MMINKKHLLIKTSFIFIILIFLLGSAAIPAAAASPIHTVTCGGTNNINGAQRIMSIYAEQTDLVGNATGYLHFYSKDTKQSAGTGIRFDLQVQYMTVEDNKAWLSGPITASTVTTGDWIVGRTVWVEVMDSGQGLNSADQSSKVWTSPSYTPDIALSKPTPPGDPPYLFDWTNGNIVVK
jgi:hypothetical protein